MTTSIRGAIALGVAATAAGAIMAIGSAGASTGAAADRVAGTWTVTVNRGPTQPALSSLQSFTRSGSVIETANTVGVRGPSHGSWKHLNNRLYASTIVFFRFDATGAFIGSQKIDRTLRLSQNGNSFTADSISQLLDPAGNVIPTPFPLRATEIARRIDVDLGVDLGRPFGTGS